MTTTRINHTGHNHPATPAGRKACRAATSDRRDRGWTSPAETIAIFQADRDDTRCVQCEGPMRADVTGPTADRLCGPTYCHWALEN